MGHRTMPHTADIRIEAWGPSRERCVAEAVTAMVEGFADTSRSRHTDTVELLVDPGTDEDLLVDVLDEVIFRLETAGQLPLEVTIVPLDSGARVRFRMTDVDGTVPVGATPKAISLHDLRCCPDSTGWSCAVTLDV